MMSTVSVSVFLLISTSPFRYCLGNLFSYHANLLNQQKRQENVSQADINQEPDPLSAQDPTMKKLPDIKTEAGVDNCGNVDDFSSIADKLFEDALLINSPWNLAFGN